MTKSCSGANRVHSFFFVCFSADWSIEVLLHRWNLSCIEVQLDQFDADTPELAGSNLPSNHSIQMMKITLKTEDAGQKAVHRASP